MEDFVTLEIAKKLKEKGFREECLYHYPNCGEDYAEANYIHGDDRFDINTDYLYQCNNNDSYLIDAPTISQTLKWLREEMDIHIEPCILASVDTDANDKVINEFTYWSFSIVSIVTGDMIYFEYKHIDDRRFDLYEQAALAGIKYALDNLI